MQINTYHPINDDSCGWTHIAGEMLAFPQMEGNIKVDWVVVGAGFTGLAAACRIAELHPNDSIVVLEAEKAGQGASARNSGYIVDITLNDGGSSLADEYTQLAKSRLNLAGLELLKKRVRQYDINCDWDESGKLHCAADARNIPKLKDFEGFLGRAGVPHTVWHQAALAQRLGTDFYQYAVQTHKGIMVNPAALVKGLLANLPSTVTLFERSPVLSIQPGEVNHLKTPNGELTADRVIVAVNALMPGLGFKRDRVFPLTLTASLTRPLDAREFNDIGQPDPWGVLSASSMGATVRLTNDRRILIRNTVEWWPGLAMDKTALEQRRIKNLLGLRKRFPGLQNLSFDYTWSGNVCISRNSKPVFEKTRDNIFLAGCYNAGGVAMGSLFGKLIVDYASGHKSEHLEQVLGQDKPIFIPPRPFLDIGLKTRLAWQRYQGRSEA
jgi:glycine/D-amino acid oxidase-like deaminating enzyme